MQVPDTSKHAYHSLERWKQPRYQLLSIILIVLILNTVLHVLIMIRIHKNDKSTKVSLESDSPILHSNFSLVPDFQLSTSNLSASERKHRVNAFHEKAQREITKLRYEQVRQRKLAVESEASKCVNILHDGYWEKPDHVVSDESLAGNSNMIWRAGESCDCSLHYYKFEEAVECLSKINSDFTEISLQNPSQNLSAPFDLIKIIGDSRGRQIFAAFSAFLTGSSTVYDNPEENTHNGHRNIFGVNLNYRHAVDLRKNGSMQKEAWQINVPKLLNLETLPILHLLTMSGKENSKNFKEMIAKHPILDTVKNYLDWTKNVKLPMIKELNTKFTILMDPEPIMPNVYQLDETRNKYMLRYLEMLDKMMPRNGFEDRIFRMTVTRKTVVSITGNYMLPDRAHLILKDKERTLPPAMKANLNIILNFVCNRRMGMSDEVCCSQSVGKNQGNNEI